MTFSGISLSLFGDITVCQYALLIAGDNLSVYDPCTKFTCVCIDHE